MTRDFEKKIYRGDCKHVLAYLIDNGVRVDLIYLDPPFNSNRVYNMIFNGGGLDAQQKAFHDMWVFNEKARQLVFNFENTVNSLDLPEAFKAFIMSWVKFLEMGNAADSRLLNYLMYMTERLVLLKNILKPTGSIYLHCDPTASHYLKIIMDGIFGSDNFRNEITWKRKQDKHNLASKKMGNICDTILWYAISKNSIYNKQYMPYTEEYIKKFYKHKDSKGTYRLLPCTNESGGNKKYNFRGITRAWRFSPENMERKYQAGLLQRSGDNSPWQYKKYLHDAKGIALDNLWLDIKAIRGKRNKRDYPTEKPIELLRRIILASSKPGDLVLDPFCGCGTTVEAAIKPYDGMMKGDMGGQARRWIGIDISGVACDEVKARIKEETGQDIKIVESNPDTFAEYDRLDPYEKQDWLVRRGGGFPNPRKSGDGGVDGELTIHLGDNNFGKAVFSVKTGAQAAPAMIRELKGTMQDFSADMGFMILDKEPSDAMVIAADKAGKIEYNHETPNGVFTGTFNRVQILTAEEIMDGKTFMHPPTLQQKKNETKTQARLI